MEAVKRRQGAFKHPVVDDKADKQTTTKEERNQRVMDIIGIGLDMPHRNDGAGDRAHRHYGGVGQQQFIEEWDAQKPSAQVQECFHALIVPDVPATVLIVRLFVLTVDRPTARRTTAHR